MERNAYKHNRLQQLRGFCHTVQCGGISKAAEQMGLSQPSVSLQIQALEKELRVTLFERRGPTIRLTPEGKSLYEMAQPLVDSLDALPDLFQQRHHALQRGNIDIAAGESTILYLLPDIIRRFTKAYPGIRIRFHNVPGRYGVRLLRKDQVDFAVGSDPEADDLSYRAIYEYDQLLITPQHHPLADHEPVTLADVSRYNFILPPRAFNTLSMVELVFQQHGLPLHVCLEAGGWEVIKCYVARGMGISIVSGICLTGDDSVTVHRLDGTFPRRTYGIVLRRGKFLSPQTKRLIEFFDPHFFNPDPGAEGKPPPGPLS